MYRSNSGSTSAMSSQAGQAMAEYIILVFALFLGLIPIIGALQVTFEEYYAFIATWMTLPIP